MNNFNDKLDNYAKLVIEIGINVQENDPVIISCPIERADFGRLLAKHAYENKASIVVFNWTDDDLSLMMYENSPMETLETIPQHEYDKSEYYYKKGAKMISVYASNPELLKNVDPDRIQRASLARNKKFKPLMKYTMNDINSWCVVSVPTQAWADTVFPGQEDSVKLLWDAIFDVTRMNLEDPIGAWKTHLEFLTDRANWLNEMNFSRLIYKSSNGTDLTIDLPQGHIWMAADSVNAKGHSFVPNIPTEEVFTLPRRDGVNGQVHSTKPLVYNGNVIDDFVLYFENGRVIDFKAKKGEKALASIFDQDENARYLGEVALVPYDSPISNSNLLFFNTLFDENASCHLAFGKAYPTNIKGGDQMTEEELRKNQVNDSFIHEDFMVGAKDLSILGIRQDGQEVKVFENGNWA